MPSDVITFFFARASSVAFIRATLSSSFLQVRQQKEITYEACHFSRVTLSRIDTKYNHICANISNGLCIEVTVGKNNNNLDKEQGKRLMLCMYLELHAP